MNASRRIVDGIAVIEVSGRMTGLDEPGQMKEQVTAAIVSGHRNIVLNLRQLSFVDSSFIGELVSCVIAVTRANGTLKLACVVRRVQELLFITRLASIIESHDTEHGAVASFSKPAN
jgi:anti-sigma B factor antagonist